MNILELAPQPLEPPRALKPDLHEHLLQIEHEAITALGPNSNLLPHDEAGTAIALALASGRLTIESVTHERGLIELSRQIGRTIAEVVDLQMSSVQCA